MDLSQVVDVADAIVDVDASRVPFKEFRPIGIFESEMRFGLRTFGLGHQDLVDLTEDEYARIAKAKDGLVVMIGVEQKFDLLLENYAEYERELLDITLRYSLHPDLLWDVVQGDIAVLNRRLANFLSAARLYIDQVSHDLSAVFGQQHQAAGAFGAKAAEEYDRRLGYRAMEALRNVMQHRSLPIYQLNYPSDRPTGHGLRFRTVPSLHTNRLRDAGFKAAVLQELEDKGEIVALTPLVRDYVDGLGHVHESVRDATSADVGLWDSVLASAQSKGNARWGGGEHRAFLAVRLDGTGQVISSVQVFTDLTKYRKALERRNGVLKNLATRYVSGEIGENDA